MKYLLIFTFTINLVTYAQDQIETEIDSVNSIVRAESFTKSYGNASIITFNKEKHNTLLSRELFDRPLFGKKVYENNIEKTTYKIIDRYKIPYYRLSYIFLDGTSLSKSEIENKRHIIIAQYKAGVPFADLAGLYSMDQNANRGGDLGWVTHGDLAKEFEEKVLTHNQSGEIYTIDIPEKKWYYVILQTHNPKLIEEIKVLKHTQSVR
jgi:parvulin-like peptidyl-prolyl isomerase